MPTNCTRIRSSNHIHQDRTDYQIEELIGYEVEAMAVKRLVELGEHEFEKVAACHIAEMSVDGLTKACLSGLSGISWASWH
jgi:hypothetical protein